MERDLDEENKAAAIESADNEKQPDKVNESLGMDGIDIVLEDYNQKQDGANAVQGQSSGNQLEESKERGQTGGSKSKLQQCCPWLSLEWLAPYF